MKNLIHNAICGHLIFMVIRGTTTKTQKVEEERTNLTINDIKISTCHIVVTYHP